MQSLRSFLWMPLAAIALLGMATCNAPEPEATSETATPTAPEPAATPDLPEGIGL
ncbi:MAG: hypothetical protein AAF609_00185 [Cyanobacteria bacterium P01_C01_bin.120]